MEDFKQQNWGGINNANQGEGCPSMPPPPPPPEITLRTMQSDMESVKQSGGENPTPQAFTPPEIKNQNMSGLDDLSKEDGMIRPGAGEGVLPPAEPPKKKGKIIILISVLILVLAGAAYAGYVYVYPMFAKPAISVNQPVVPETTIPETEIPETIVVVPPEEEIIATSTPEEMATTTPEEILPPPIFRTHVSALVSPADSIINLSVTGSTTLASIRDLLVAEAGNKPAVETFLKEVSLSDAFGQLVFADVFSMFLPEVTSFELSQYFQEDFTSVIFYDNNGAWFGLVAKLKEGASVSEAKTLMSKLEPSSGLANLYLQDPGTKNSAGFKDGSANSVATRYLSFSNIGASLNYGWTPDNTFVLSTSYNGMKAMLVKLGIQ